MATPLPSPATDRLWTLLAAYIASRQASCDQLCVVGAAHLAQLADRTVVSIVEAVVIGPGRAAGLGLHRGVDPDEMLLIHHRHQRTPLGNSPDTLIAGLLVDHEEEPRRLSLPTDPHQGLWLDIDALERLAARGPNDETTVVIARKPAADPGQSRLRAFAERLRNHAEACEHPRFTPCKQAASDLRSAAGIIGTLAHALRAAEEPGA